MGQICQELHARRASVAVRSVLPHLRSVFQPVVDLSSREVVGVEALVRCPAGARFDGPTDLFAEAAVGGVLTELDRACRATAFAGAAAAGLDPGLALFVNLEPGAIDEDDFGAGDDAWRAIGPDGRPRRLVFEITERWLTRRPAELLAAVAEIRRRGIGVALDDVGVDARSLALLPLLAPDVIKLDMALVQDGASIAAARTLAAVAAAAERTGAVVVAEGIEDEGHLERAVAFGATLGQGWLLGRPSSSVALAPAAVPLRLVRPATPVHPSPFASVAGAREVRIGTKLLLKGLSQHLEAKAAQQGESGIVLATFQSARRFTDRTADRYAALASVSALVAVFADGLPSEPAPGVRGTSFSAGDPLTGEWSVIVLGPHFAAALLACDLAGADRHGPGRDDLRRFRFVLTHDHDVVVRAARTLVARVDRS